MKKTQKILLTALVLIIIGFSLYIYKNTLPETTPWNTYVSVGNTFEIKYPPTWGIEDTSYPSALRIANISQSRPDSDQPNDMVLIIRADVACKESDWATGFGLAYWKTICIPDSSLTITASALNEKSISEVEAVLSTLKITGIVVSSPAQVFLETMKMDLGISSEVLVRSGRMGLKDGTIANNVSGYELSYPPLGSKDNSYVLTKLKSDGLGSNTTELSEGYTDGKISCNYGTTRDESKRYIFCIDLDGVKGEGPGNNFRG